ncbi:MAG: hypothetical protein J5629_09575 [Muribaculaceae bacterium]|nr:hypothetical protein [Muribaculaceae bacterium]
MLNIMFALVQIISVFIINSLLFSMISLFEFATPEMLTKLLVKERAKCRRRNRSEKKENKKLIRDCDINILSTRKMLSRMMPPRYTWVRPSKRIRLKNGAMDTSKNAEKALLVTIKRDRSRKGEKTPVYLQELDAFINRIRERLKQPELTLESPQLLPIFKSKSQNPDGSFEVTCRPLSVYNKLEDKIIIAVTSRYLTRFIDKHLHKNILSYRNSRSFCDKEHHTTDFNDGIKLIENFRKEQGLNDIYVADCDIKKFYDTIPHNVVIESFERILDKTRLDDDGKNQVMKVLKAYLDSYNFYDNAWLEAESNPYVYFKVRRQMRDIHQRKIYKLGWVDDIMALPENERRQRGVPQGGALSLVIANVVLNDVDQVIVQNEDTNRLFIRYCDDMIMMHTSRDECDRLMKVYAQSLTEHGLYYHDFEFVADSKNTENPMTTNSHFWDIKSHSTYLWGDGEGNSNRYIGFLGYEMQRNGKLRLRKANIQRFKEKVNRLFYALLRFQKNEKKTDEEKAEHKEKTFKNLMDGINFYTAFDQARFQNSKQFRLMKDMRDNLEARLAKQ